MGRDGAISSPPQPRDFPRLQLRKTRLRILTWETLRNLGDWTWPWTTDTRTQKFEHQDFIVIVEENFVSTVQYDSTIKCWVSDFADAQPAGIPGGLARAAAGRCRLRRHRAVLRPLARALWRPELRHARSACARTPRVARQPAPRRAAQRRFEQDIPHGEHDCDALPSRCCCCCCSSSSSLIFYRCSFVRFSLLVLPRFFPAFSASFEKGNLMQVGGEREHEGQGEGPRRIMCRPSCSCSCFLVLVLVFYSLPRNDDNALTTYSFLILLSMKRTTIAIDRLFLLLPPPSSLLPPPSRRSMRTPR